MFSLIRSVRPPVAFLVLLVSGLLSPAISAQHAPLAADALAAAAAPVDPGVAAFEGVRALGRRWDLDAYERTVALYTAVHRAIDWPGVLDPESVAYGPDPAQHLLLFRPEQEFSEPGPVFLFVHGNGLGESGAVVPGSEGLIYSHMGKIAAVFGGIGIVPDYRSGAAPESAVADLGLVIDWARNHVADSGGDPETIVLLANSSGATIAAHYLFDRKVQAGPGPGIAAAILSSGFFGAASPGLAELVDAYEGPRTPLALWSAEYDPPIVETGVAELYLQLCRKYAECPSFDQIRNHNHVSQIMSFGTSDTTATGAMIRFYHTVR